MVYFTSIFYRYILLVYFTGTCISVYFTGIYITGTYILVYFTSISYRCILPVHIYQYTLLVYLTFCTDTSISYQYLPRYCYTILVYITLVYILIDCTPISLDICTSISLQYLLIFVEYI